MGNGFQSGFLAKYWQKRPCNEVFALPVELPALSADEIAWLATQTDVESRLVFTEQTADGTAYRLENGPFTTAELENLPDRDWTLLVQDVDKHLPEFTSWFEMTRFIPRWRTDDLMISIAAPGGSVGPHRDNYDVFLCQGKGHRLWTLGAPADARQAAHSGSLSLLEPFEARQSIAAGPGHVLYLPPRIPHWGIAVDLCITYSIGFRAPTIAELGATARRAFNRSTDLSADETFYADPDLDPAEAEDGRISERTIERIREQGLVANGFSGLELARIFGMTVTDPKAWLDPDPMPMAVLDAALARHEGCHAHGMALLTWYRSNEAIIVFLNGRERTLRTNWEQLIRTMCRSRSWTSDELQSAVSLPDGRNVLAWLCEKGLFDASEQPR